MPRLPSDYGGQPAGEIDQSVYEPSQFDKNVDALRILMGKVDPRMTSDVSRRTQAARLPQTSPSVRPSTKLWHCHLRKC